MQNGPFIVTGASGHLGRQVVDHLFDGGAAPIVAVTRNPEKLSDLKEKGVDVRQGDFNDPASLGTAFAGGKRILIISTDDLEPGKRLAAHSNAIAAAAKTGYVTRADCARAAAAIPTNGSAANHTASPHPEPSPLRPVSQPRSAPSANPATADDPEGRQLRRHL